VTARERDVLALIAQGKTNKEIAAGLHLDEGTVKGYVSAISPGSSWPTAPRRLSTR
jgi:DNA-binding NarL/FixJ family response regulator